MRLASGLDDAAGGCRQVAEVLAGYGAALRGLERRVMTARHEVETARVRAVAARERYAAALAGGVVTVPWSWTDAPAFAAVPQAAAELGVWRSAVRDAAEGLRAFAACCDEREDLDRQTAARLVGVEVMGAYAPGTGVDAIVDVPLAQALASVAAGTMTSEERSLLARWFSSAADEVAVDELTSFLDAWGSDTGVMAAVFAAMGGERTMRLLTALGNAVPFAQHHHPNTLSALGTQVRAGLAVGSRGWSKAQVESFADEMFRQMVFFDGASVVGYLFADPDRALMSAALTVAVADRIDGWEREHGRLPPGGDQPGYWLASAAVPGSDPRAVLDPAAGVLATLGAYPQVARDWLTGVDVDWSNDAAVYDRARVDYWFEERAWPLGISDGFAGVATLWLGVQSAMGSPQEVWQRAALNDAIFARFSRNAALLLTENISPPASLRLAQVVASQIVTLVEVGGMRGPINDRAAWELVPTPFDPDKAVAATVTRVELVRILAAATSEPEGRLAVQRALLGYEVDALALAADGTASVDRVLERLAVVWAVADGAVNGATQAELQRVSDEVRVSLGLARVPVDVALAFVPNPIVAIGLDAAVDYLEKLAVEHWTPGQPEPASVRSAGADPISLFFTDAVQTYRDAGLWDQPALRSDSAEELAGAEGLEYVQMYQDVSLAVHSALQESSSESGGRSGEGA
ncbi:hypothetical protein [Cellulomonas xiejunii]|uniref:Uncharacterized protein n=1 Tax=Cellulomonas xiejunii TaxID=2968083 RepID=A0ABY5KM02_9CELL|nr:hypothetical protein [Cellulomonas xiejunii]UUI71537.1 hypothetical protein NP048_17370 [Cellulomonas xiejunii]